MESHEERIEKQLIDHLQKLDEAYRRMRETVILEAQQMAARRSKSTELTFTVNVKMEIGQNA